MKTIIFFFLLTVQYFAQVQGCVFSETLDTTGSINNHKCGSAMEFWYLTVALADSGDTLIVYSLADNPDSTIDDEDSVAVSMVDITTGDDVDNGIITGNEARHTYLLKWAYKRKSVKLFAYKAPNGISYILGAY
jgi:hypothetical protein